MLQRHIMAGLIGLLPCCALAQTDTVAKGNFKPYKEIITEKAVSRHGLLSVHQVGDKYYFELPASLLNRDLLVVTRLSRSSSEIRIAGFYGFSGDQINEGVIKFEQGPGNKIFLRKISYGEYVGDSTRPMYRNVINSNLQPIVASFSTITTNPQSKAYVIEVTDFLSNDNNELFFDAEMKSMYGLANLNSDKSYIASVNSYPQNTEIKTVKTYTRLPARPGQMSEGTATFEINSSLVLLPAEPMKPRLADERVGYFSSKRTDFDADPQGVKKIEMSTRWRLEPKEEDLQRYFRGELVEPKKPIIYYIDPATPKKWVPYLMQGVNDWQVAFEKAGFKNAIIAKEAPSRQEDSTWSLEDARYSAIVYKPSSTPNASGPHVHDPRTGEILETHINWYHNVMKLLRDWYLVQTAAVDPDARGAQLPDSLMGQLIRFVSSHEVGHTLGLKHNFGSSSTVPVEKLRDKAWVEANGHTPSIMDYARFNYVAQPEDNIGRAGLFPRIGDYDKWAIEWAYKILPGNQTPESEAAVLSKLTSEKLKNNRLWFGNESESSDPRSQNEDLGDDAVKAGTYGIKNLQRIVPNLAAWTRTDNEGYELLKYLNGEVGDQFMQYMFHATKNIGGIYHTPKTAEQPGKLYEPVFKAKQVAALEFLSKQLFTTPLWLVDNNIIDKTGINPIALIGSKQESIITILLSEIRFDNLIAAEARLGKEAYTLQNFMNDLQKEIWSELYTHKPIDVYRRNLQKIYVNKMVEILKPAKKELPVLNADPKLSLQASDILSIVKSTLRTVRQDMIRAIPATNDPMTKYHLQDEAERIATALENKK
ncbi:zinc-dependent metalloprotease [Paraflavitalea sp. CAU 1676]|uniref:zinc-dependent metalloprotease n=1 Tax=Paraflavitalea sp. CAU 1676 TaxID=3032598 RepID=UPI0023D9F871|nr:zinc-dependent metalloprotease [Paraflavitalea sp. CAU 1676]MDF2188009.1 zinc-dependent metalloprotease [Paraflavitalea sp. CAU 1676]